MIRQYNKGFLAGLIPYNDPLVEEWADNVYEKIRQNGELAGYVERDKVVRERFDIEDNSVTLPISIKDDDFTFGYAYCGEELKIVNNQYCNLGKNFQIEFELLIEEDHYDISLFDGFIRIALSNIMIGNSAYFIPHNFIKGTLQKFKIIRSNYNMRLFIDDVETFGYSQLSDDIDSVFNTLYKLNLGIIYPVIYGPLEVNVGDTETYTTAPGMTNYYWEVSAGGTITVGGGSEDSSVSINWFEAGLQTVTISYTENDGCSGTATIQVNVI